MPWNAIDVASLLKLAGSRDKDSGSMPGSLISLFDVHQETFTLFLSLLRRASIQVLP